MTKDLTKGSPTRLILGFAIPMLLGMLFQQFYSMIDAMIVGRFLGVNPLAGVGSTGSLNFMIIGFCIGVCTGFAIPVAQMFGANNEKELRGYVAGSIWLSILFSIVMTVVVVIFCKPILHLMNTPEEIFDYAYIYIVIIFIGIPSTYLYNLLSGIIRALGDSKTPVIFLAFSSLINIVLDIVFILVFHMNVEGPALATVISQWVSGIVCIFYAYKKFPILRLKKEELIPTKHQIWILCITGIPMGLQYSITAIGTLVIQWAVNGLGAIYVAAVSAAQKVNFFICCPFDALGGTMATYAGQNVGAKKLDRLNKGMWSASFIGIAYSIFAFFILYFTGRQMIMLFIDPSETKIIYYGWKFLVITSSAYILLVFVNVVRFAIQGMGYSAFAIIAGIMEMLARTTAGIFLVPIIHFYGICFAHPMAWIAADLFLLPAFYYCLHKLKNRPVLHNNDVGVK